MLYVICYMLCVKRHDYPIVAYVNTKSGGRMGETVIHGLMKIIGPANVHDLNGTEGDPPPK